jgi:hypothetical protein
MAREDFFDSLLLADRLLPPMKVSGPGSRTDAYFSGDPWLSPDSVEGFDPADFADWSREEREKLKREVDAFLAIAQEVPPNEPVTRRQSEPALKHLTEAMKIVRNRLVPEWREAQEKMLEEATAAAQAKGWYVEKDEKKIEEGLLGTYKAPRLLIRNPEKEVWLTPVARFCAGRQGVVDLKVSPTFDRAYIITYQDGRWQIASLQGRLRKRPFTKDTFANIISELSQL